MGSGGVTVRQANPLEPFPPRLGGSPHYAPDVTLSDALLIYGATARLTRLVTDDTLGLWWVREPAYRAAIRHVERHGDVPWWDKYRAGLECPYCVGFWVGALVLASHAVAGKSRPWRFVAASLTLNLVAAPLVARLGGSSDEPADETTPAVLTARQRPTADLSDTEPDWEDDR